MIVRELSDWNTYVKILGPNDELPIPNSFKRIYLDYETTSGDIKKTSLNPHGENCKILGVAVLFNDEPVPYYVPVRHTYIDYDGERKPRDNYNLEKIYDWLRLIIGNAEWWINQNIKYDVHVQVNEFGLYPKCRLADVMNLTKLSEFPEEYNYNLTNIMKMFYRNIEHYEDALAPYKEGNKDYGLIPPDILGPYAAVDVLSVRYIHDNIKIHADCADIVETENQILKELIRMEQIGVRINIEQIGRDWDRLIPAQEKRLARIRQIADYPDFDPSKEASKKELFIGRMGWDIDVTKNSKEVYEDTGDVDDLRASFSKITLLKHRHKNQELVDTWLAYARDQKILTSFIVPYIEEHTQSDWLIHCNFNQIVRTGRMSCRNPNLQQIPRILDDPESTNVKKYFIPYNPDYLLVEFDLSQIEFRVIVHYIENERCLQAYQNDPTTDFHTWVAGICGIGRTPAKRMNFMLGYGGGKKKTVAVLCELPEIVSAFSTQHEIAEYASNIYETYHRNLPELKINARAASSVYRTRGYVKTLFGRHRNLPKNFKFMPGDKQGAIANRGFNTTCQGTAADMQKKITLRLRKYISQDCFLHLLVHDAWLFSIKKNRADELIPAIKAEIERPFEEVEFKVPILSEMKSSEISWGDC